MGDRPDHLGPDELWASPESGEARLRQVRAVRKWLREACAELREERLRPFEDHSQRIWEELRQQSNVDLRSVRLTGSEKASVHKLVMDVSIDGTEAAALGVMSQGELHSLALSLFLPRAAAQGSPFGFVVIDDPVQSMDPAKVIGLAKVCTNSARAARSWSSPTTRDSSGPSPTRSSR